MASKPARGSFGEPLDYKSLGFSRLRAFLHAFPRVCRVTMVARPPHAPNMFILLHQHQGAGGGGVGGEPQPEAAAAPSQQAQEAPSTLNRRDAPAAASHPRAPLRASLAVSHAAVAAVACGLWLVAGGR